MLGTTFGPYTIEAVLGRGGMGEVYRAFDTETDREVALKVLPLHLAGDEEYKQRFRRECRAAARLNEPHVVPIHRFGEIDGRLYLDMRLVEGADLATWLADHGPLTPQAAVAVISQVAGALDAAHAEGILHRDVKPSNILLSGVGKNGELDPGSVFAYLFDFGIASADTDQADGGALTRTGTVPGSVPYLAPERFRGVPADRRVDVYALACVLYQTLTGTQPFSGDLATLMNAHLTQPPPSPSANRASVPPALDEVIARGMAKDREHRYPSAGALAAAARAAVGPVAAAPTVPVPPGHDPRLSAFGQGGPTPPPATMIGPAWGQPAPGSSWPGTPHGTQQFAGHSPYPSAPPVPPPRGSGSRAAAIAIVVAVIVVLGGAGAAAVILLPKLTGLANDKPASTSSIAEPTPQTIASAAPTAADSPEVAALRAMLPQPFPRATCDADATTARGLGASAYLACSGATEANPDGPDTGTFSHYTQQSALDQAFDSAARSDKVPVVESGELTVCRDKGSQATGYDRRGVHGGRVGCFIDPANGHAYLFWTDNDAMALGYVLRSDGDAAKLYAWWQANDFKVEGR